MRVFILLCPPLFIFISMIKILFGLVFFCEHKWCTSKTQFSVQKKNIKIKNCKFQIKFQLWTFPKNIWTLLESKQCLSTGGFSVFAFYTGGGQNNMNTLKHDPMQKQPLSSNKTSLTTKTEHYKSYKYPTALCRCSYYSFWIIFILSTA